MTHIRKSFIYQFSIACLFFSGYLFAAEEHQGVEKKPDQVASIENSVVKIFATVRAPDHLKPWTKSAPNEITGSGVVISGKRILTNAHVVRYASQVQIQANQSGDKLSATVVAVAPGIDLALLKLDDETFFDTHSPITRENVLPEVKDAVMAYGYPTGGTSLSITKGIVSRIEFANYSYGVSGMRIQIDAAINPGNSGGPVLAGEKMIGLAYAALNNAQNIGYIIPNEEIELFLRAQSGGIYEGKPALFDGMQTLENASLRRFLNIDKKVEGMVVREPYKDDATYPLKEWDIVTAIGDHSIDNQGMVKVTANLRVGFRYYVQQLNQAGKVSLSVIRKNKNLQIQVPTTYKKSLLMKPLEDQYPKYFIYGPVAFSVVSVDLLSALSKESFPWVTNHLYGLTQERANSKREELVVIPAPLFPHKLVVGYQSRISGAVVASVNDIPIRNLVHLVTTLRDLKSEFVVFRFEQESVDSLVLRREDVVAATEEILNDNGIRSQGSSELMSVWKTK